MKYSIQWLCIMYMLILPSISPAYEWVARYDGPMSGPDKAYAIAVDAAGNVYVTGRVVEPDRVHPGIYFLEIDEKIVQKVIKVR